MGKLRSPVVAIATCGEVVGRVEDDLRLIEALEKSGIAAVHAVWDDPKMDWSAFALVVIRSTWDYAERHGEFLAWVSRLPKVLNPLPILRWNTDKRYLMDLAKAGLPVIPTHFLEPNDVFQPLSSPFVVKPAISCAAKNTARYDIADEAKAHDHVRRLQGAGRTVMIQPYLEEVEESGEVNVVFIGGAYSHAIRRDASLSRSGENEGPAPLNVQAYEPTTEERALAEQVLTRLPGGQSDLLYARVDLISGPMGPVILEVELTEPTLFLEYSAGAVERLARLVERSIKAA